MYTQKIVPHLWYNTEAREAVALYTTVFPDSRVTKVTTLHGTPSGDVDIVSFVLAGQSFMAMSAGPHFTLNPSVSFLVACSTKEEVNAVWEKLNAGGTALMELGAYPFSEWYGWTRDRYGLSWQVMYMGDMGVSQKITPTLMFVGGVCGKAEEAIQFYTSVFSRTAVSHIMRYEKGEEPDKEGSVKHAGFTLEGMEFAAMDSAHKHEFAFSEAMSFIVNCDTQKEIDYFWDKLSAVPEAEQCGWVKDRFGVSWQIVPAEMDAILAAGDEAKRARVTQAILTMKKLDLEALRNA